MRHLPLLLFTLLALGVTQGQLSSRYPALNAHPLEAELLDASNQARLAHGLPPLQSDPQLALAARHHAAEMVELGYFSHTSPRADTAGLLERLIWAGSPVQYAAENLALLPKLASAAQDAIEGWLESPGHRANLLDAQHSHVGFGVAHDGQQLTIVQVLAYQPLLIQAINLSSDTRLERTLNVKLELHSSHQLMLASGERYHGPFALGPGVHPLTLPAPPQDPIHLHVGLAASAQAHSFIVEDEGWYSAAEHDWRASPSAPRQQARIIRVQHRDEEQPWVRLELSSAEPLPTGLAVWLGDDPYEHRLTGSHRLELSLPERALPANLSFALPETRGTKGSYLLVARLQLARDGGELRVRAGSSAALR